MTTLLVPHRFNGPPRSGNGGWVAGALAARLPGQGLGRPITVTLRQPPPLETPLTLAVTDGGASISHDGRPVAVATYAEDALVPVAPVLATRAAEAEEAYAGHRLHPFPTCFVCGTDRRPGDGLRIFPGPVGTERVAATWTPYESSVALAWAALDCPGGWSSDLEGRPSVLGRITVEVRHLPHTSQRYVVVGEQRALDGRKTFTAATLYGAGDEVVATAEHVWIAIDPEEFR
ncbi:hypothetical protein [Nocardioides convexus]|uniref:hypothetical protein n=1 Tax=Nocardioides convexus TaxID=2712224 RepID=UPI0024189631|nr:hypothetical protein [Nocardioides convexus]